VKAIKIDKVFLVSVVALALGGFFIFTSASLGLLTSAGATFSSETITQAVSLLIGFILFYVASKIPYKFWKKYALYVLLAAIAINLLLFIPHFTLNHGGAGRWLQFGSLTLQTSEFLKIGFIIYFAAWLAYAKDRVSTFKMGMLPFVIIVGILGSLLLVQSDTFTLLFIVATGLGMFIAAGGRFLHILYIVLIAGLVVGGVVLTRPYARARVMTFLNPAADSQGAGYQIQQSLIAIGSGKMFGRGYGQSVQKFGYLPQPTDDSIFSVFAEEFGFVGSVTLIVLFLLFVFRSFKIATRAPDPFGRLLVLGISMLIIIESFANIAALMGIIPLSGKPLLFVSHGGTALLIILATVGIIANVSKFQKK
jgi:cell division protein FtsW